MSSTKCLFILALFKSYLNKSYIKCKTLKEIVEFF